MAAPTTLDDFVELCRKSQLVDQKELAEYLAQLPARAAPPDTSRRLARAMLEDGLLTRFQAEQLLLGKWRNFLVSGKYKLLERLGIGGMGIVFLCEQIRLKRRVALKFLPRAHHDNPTMIERFYREGRATAALDHPNLVKVHDLDCDDQRPYLVIEYIDGSSLYQIVDQRGPLDLVRACHYIYQAALGLQHAHEAGMVHRDIKPGNILLDRSGTVKILDLGLAKCFGEDDKVIQEEDSGTVLGTADFMSPEQALCSENIDIRADIYSLGATFHYLLTGQGPFGKGTLNQILMWHQMRQPERVDQLRPEVSRELAAIIETMLAKNPAQRFQSPTEVTEALAPWVKSPIPPPPQEEMPCLSLAARGSGPRSSGISSTPRAQGNSGAIAASLSPARWLKEIQTASTVVGTSDTQETPAAGQPRPSATQSPECETIEK